jgi:glycosyltransferase involved in cell wall biosynthesis
VTGQPIDSFAVIGNAADPATWSGIPYHFGAAAAAAGWQIEPWRLDLAPFRWPRRRWNLGRLARFRRPGGYQYSPEFLDAAEAQIPRELKSGRVLSFNQFFPRARTLARHGGKLILYIDATFPRLLDRYGFSRDMDRRTADEARRAERENLAAAEVVVAFQQWTADSLVQECAVDPSKVRIVLPGANLIPDVSVAPPVKTGVAGTDRPLVLGFVGKDWKRKNLPFLVNVARKLETMGVKAEVHCAGGCPPELQRDPLVKWLGFLDKQHDPAGFIRFLQGCDLGCLFSLSEASSIAVLEFLRVGVPVAGFVVDGMGDLLLPGAAVRFAPGASADEVAESLADAAGSDRLRRLRAGAAEAMPVVTWGRCLRDLTAALEPEVAGTISIPLLTAGRGTGHSS